jgi:hypothetical protein
VPWCDECAKFWSPNSLPTSGACPTCGRVIGAASAHRAVAEDGTVDEGEPIDDYKAPWHFKLMIVLAAVYLAWRFIQVATWIV